MGDSKVNLNGQVRWDDSFDIREADYFNGSGVDTADELLLRGGPVSDISYEVGGDIEFSAVPKTNTKIVALYRSGHESAYSSIEIARMGQPVTLFETRSRNTPTEAVVRIQNDWSGVRGGTQSNSALRSLIIALMHVSASPIRSQVR